MTTVAAIMAIALCLYLVSLLVRGLYRTLRAPPEDFISDDWKPPRRDE